MNRFNKYILILLAALFIAGCDKTDPTILEPDPVENDRVEIEVLTSDPESEISRGLDSTGTVEELTRFANYIGVSGIKITDNSFTTKISIAQAMFFDRSLPIHDSNGKLIGYRARSLGEVRFNDVPANVVPLRIRIKDKTNFRDTLIGFQHLLYKGRGNHSDPFDFVYNSSINFRFHPFFSLPVSFEIPTPKEITGNLLINRSNRNNKLQALISWNRSQLNTIEIIIGARIRNKNIIIPLYRIKTPDDGNLFVPQGLLESIPVDKFNKIIVSLIRKYEGQFDSGESDLFVRSQSIHSIIVDIP